jgi:SAM-dependent methyltransferase
VPDSAGETDDRMRDTFARIYDSGEWGVEESRSGFGSNLVQTEVVRAELPRLVAELGVRSFLDVPCGDWFWMSHVDLGVDSYVGADVVPWVVDRNRERFGRPGREFRVLDLLRDPLPRADLVFCRDCLVHFSDADVRRALDNVRASGATWLVTTTFPEWENWEIDTGGWRPINLGRAPFTLPPPVELVNEHCTEYYPQFTDKSLGVWRVADL